MDQRPVQRDRARTHGAAEEVANAQTERRAARDLDARVAQPVRPLDRGQPLLLRRRTGRAIVDAALPLAPASLEAEPGVRRRRGRWDVRQEHGLEFQPPCGVTSVVATKSLAPASSEVQRSAKVVGVRARRVVDDRVRALLLELGVGPRRPLPAGVLRKVNLVRARSKRRRDVRRREVDLGHLPIALVLVGEVVERVVEPVLHRELAGVRRIGGHVRVDARRPAVVPFPELPLIATARDRADCLENRRSSPVRDPTDRVTSVPASRAFRADHEAERPACRGRCRRSWAGTPHRTRTPSAAARARAPVNTSRPAPALPTGLPEPQRAEQGQVGTPASQRSNAGILKRSRAVVFWRPAASW